MGKARPFRSRPRWLRRLLSLTASLIGGAVIVAVGWTLSDASQVAGLDDTERPEKPAHHRVVSSFAESLARLSYDLPFTVAGTRKAPEACVVSLDEASRMVSGVVHRSIHTQLVKRLTEEGARLIFFDVVMSKAWSDPTVDVDTEFTAAAKESGRVCIGGALELEGESGVYSEVVVAPLRLFRQAGIMWGLLAFRPVDADYGVRRIYMGTDLAPSATWKVAVKLGAPLTDTFEARQERRWLNYYGRPGAFVERFSHTRVLAADGVRPGTFRDRIVFIGGVAALGKAGLGKDEFRSPYQRTGGEFFPGVEVHLTALLNLLHGDWLTRLEARRELWIVLATGLLLGMAMPLMRPHFVVLAALGAMAITAGVVFWFLQYHRTWFAWSIPVLVQTPLAVAWAIGTRYFVEERRRSALRSAFAHYLSPQMADRIADADFDLTPGGEVIEASVVFTDLEAFTALSEKLNDPKQLSDVLITYFTETTAHVLKNDGTIIKYIGDAVLAVWGAPLPDADHAAKAALAACELHAASHIEFDGRPLRTRVGLHTGQMLAGNLGSAQRFDYTVIGDAVNFASRLEGLNKYLGTDILISDATRQRLGTRFIARRLGEFRVVGKSDAVVIHELIGPADGTALARPWLETFERGLEAFRGGELSEAERLMRETREIRGGTDGPAEFYLERLPGLMKSGLPAGWTGAVEITAK